MPKMRFGLTSTVLALFGVAAGLGAIPRAAEAQAVVGGYYYPPAPVYVAPPPIYAYPSPPAYYYPPPPTYYYPPPPAYYYPPPVYYSRPSYWAPGISATFTFGGGRRWHH